MRSSSGEHYVALDQVRAVAAFLVFTWHFTHAPSGGPVPLEYVPLVPPFALLDEGHTGVAVFMTLSGYLFARLLQGRVIDYRAFLWNRLLRLLPLLAVVLLAVGLFQRGDESVGTYLRRLVSGAVLPSLPNGGWSITTEFHFYALLPVLLWVLRRSPFLALALVPAALALRAVLHGLFGEVQTQAYWTIVGRFDQFVLGMIACRARSWLAGRHLVAGGLGAGLVAFYTWFDAQGGLYQYPSYPSPSRLWIVFPTLEGVGYATLIAWYEASFAPRGRLARGVAWIGERSYSIYLLHFFFVFELARFVDRRIMGLSNFYVACCWALVCFFLMLPLAEISWRLVEAPPLRYRRRYVAEASRLQRGMSATSRAVLPRQTTTR